MTCASPVALLNVPTQVGVFEITEHRTLENSGGRRCDGRLLGWEGRAKGLKKPAALNATLESGQTRRNLILRSPEG